MSKSAKNFYLGIKNKEKLRYNLTIPADATVKSLIEEFDPCRYYRVHCLYSNNHLMGEVATIINDEKILDASYDALQNLSVSSCWVEFSPTDVNYTVYLKTTEEDLYQRTPLESLARMLTQDPFLTFLGTLCFIIIVYGVILGGFVVLAIPAFIACSILLFDYSVNMLANRAKVKRLVRIYMKHLK